MGSLLWNKLTIGLVAAGAVFIALDINKHGSYKGSRTNEFLNSCGALQYGELVFTRFRAHCQQVYRWSQKRWPLYMDHNRERLVPVVRSVKDVLTDAAFQVWTYIRLLYQYFVDKTPVVLQWVNDSEFIDSISLWLTQTWTLMKEKTQQVQPKLHHYYIQITNWLQTNVFVGQFAIENLQRRLQGLIYTFHYMICNSCSWITTKIQDVLEYV